MIFLWIVRALVTLLALTNRILVVCYVKLLEKHDLCCAFFQTCFMFDTGIFLFVVFTIILTRLISLSIIFFVKILLLVLSGG